MALRVSPAVSSPRLPSRLTSFVPALAIAAVSLALFPVPAGVAVEGLILGLLGAMLAVGMALVTLRNRRFTTHNRAIMGRTMVLRRVAIACVGVVAILQWAIVLERSVAAVWAWYKFVGYGGGGHISLGQTTPMVFCVGSA